MTLLLRNVRIFRLHPHRTLCTLHQFIPSKSPYLFYPPMTQALCSSLPSPRPYTTEKPPSVTLQQKLKKAVAEYGSTVIVFHVGISLVSLGVCYLLVSSGLDVENVMNMLGISATKVVTNAGTFAVAYAVHKVFAPARVMVTLAAAPFIVRYLRTIGFLKKPPSK